MKYLFAVLLIINHAETAAQKDSIIQSEQTGHRRFIYLTATKIDTGQFVSWKYDLRTYKDEVQTVFSLDTLFRDNCHGWPAAERNIQFVNDSTGYLYGYTMGYGYCTYIFRTRNGGRSWERMSLTGSYNTLSEREFFMFNEAQGIALPGVMKDTLSWQLTADGGKTWKVNTLRLEGLKHESVIKPVYSSEGTVVFILERPWFKGRTTSVYDILRSDDFGKTFRLLR